GEDTAEQFNQFMEKHPGFFPSGINSTEELLEYLAERMAAASLAFGALSEEQQAELAQLASSVFSDMDLSWQMSRLMSSLSELVDPRSLARMGFRGNEAMSTQDAAGALAGLGELDSTESFLRAVTDPSDLGRLDLEHLSELLGQQEAKSLQRLAEVAQELQEAGLIAREGERLTISAKGLRRIGEKMLAEVFAKLDAGRFGAHARMRSGAGIDKEFETRPYEFGDPLDLALPETLRNTIVRQRGGVPLKVSVEDFEIETREALVAASTVLCLDLSLSMPLRDNFMSAKKVAVALQGLISSRYPRDFLAVVGFSEVAHQIRPSELPSVSWDYAYGTNMEDALRLSRKLLAGRPGKRQVLMITDGEPTAHILENGEPFFSYPPVPETIAATLAEVRRCTREGITVNSFVLDANEYLRDFMSRVARINRGRVFYTAPDDLGAYVLVDFMDTHL
ncbi:MAG: VWA domain-containing protein, partial [Actinomycetota bacterium]|nr:VWA domain-containing protein [Actinomycetota bacterium]